MATNYTCEVSHKELGKHQILTGTDKTALEGEANALKRTWNAQATLEQIRNILLTSLSGKHTIDWQKLKMPEGESMPGEWEFLYKLTNKKPKPVPPVYLEYPLEPQRTEPRYQALDNYTVREYIYVRDYEKWAEKVKEAEAENQRRYDESAAEFAEWDAWTAEHPILQIRQHFRRNAADFRLRLLLPFRPISHNHAHRYIPGQCSYPMPDTEVRCVAVRVDIRDKQAARAL